MDDVNALTQLGMQLAKLPLDPRIGRMILAAREQHSLDEVLIIASALSVQDVRDRPLEHQQAADEKHKRFDDERSEFVGYLKLWAWVDEGRGGHGSAAANGRILLRLHGSTFGKIPARVDFDSLRENGMLARND